MSKYCVYADRECDEDMEEAYRQGVLDEQNRIIDILKNNWLHGSVNCRIIDEIISHIKNSENKE